MATKRKTAHRVARRATRTTTPADRLRAGWNATVDSLTAAEAGMEKQVRAMMRRRNISTKSARVAFDDMTHRVNRERRKAMRMLETRFTELQHRITKERKQVVRMVDNAVDAALATVNMPSRREVSELSHKVDELSRKIDGLRASRRAATRRTRALAGHA